MGDSVSAVSGDPERREPGCETARLFLAPSVSADLPPAPKSAGVREPAADAFKAWTPSAQERALELIRQVEQSPWRPFYCPITTCDGQPHDNWTWPHARGDQHPPPMYLDWLVWLLNGGRGGGKTRAGSELTHRMTEKVARIALIAPTGPDLRDTMVEGVSGIIATAHPDRRPIWEPSKKKLTWPNGCIAQGFSGEEPDRLRGPQHGFAWIDEPAHMALIQDVWDNLLFGLRLGRAPRICASTTPKPTKWMKALVKDERTIISRFSTYANLSNLAETFKRTVLDKYEGTRLGRQELHAEVLEDVEGSLWWSELIIYVEADQVPMLDRIVVSVDPAGSTNKTSDETGIIVVGIKGYDIYVLADKTDKYSPDAWASAAIAAYEQFSADCIVTERNYGGDMVRAVLRHNDKSKSILIRDVNSRRGKAIRAEPIVGLYERGLNRPERGRVFHVREATPLLEDEMLTWIPGEGDSPNRVDALVHGATELAKLMMPMMVADPTTLRRMQSGIIVPNRGGYMPTIGGYGVQSR